MTSLPEGLRRFLSAAVLVGACLIRIQAAFAGEPADMTAAELDQVRRMLRPLDLRTPPQPSEIERRYFQFYDLDVPDAAHHFGSLPVVQETLAVHVYQPRNPRGTVFLVHGYYDHAGILSHLIHRLAGGDFAVVVYDQPGHGLSTGPRASIENFGDYTDALESVLTALAGELPAPQALIAHSMGAAVTLDYLSRGETVPLERVVLLAPLVRSSHWGVSRLGFGLMKNFTNRTKRIFRENSSDPDFMDFVKNRDPLMHRYVPFAWVEAHHRWFEQIQDYPVLDRSIHVLQGRKDGTVDWRYNIPFLTEKIADCQVTFYPEGRHQLLNESLDLRDEILDRIVAVLSK